MNIKTVIFLVLISNAAFSQQYPFQNTNLDMEKRIDNLLSIMTLDEKVACLSTKPDVPRLGIKGTDHVEGLHGLAMGGPSDWGQKNPHCTTIFPQAIGLAQTWDTALIRKVAFTEAYETRYMFQSKYKRGGLVVRAPNADIGRDIRWGRTEECYGEDAWFNAQMVTAFVIGLQGDNPKYWLTASLMKHFLANSNENSRDSSSSNFSKRLFYEYYSYPFFKGITEGGSNAYMAAYNSYNQIPMTVNPVLKQVTVDKWKLNGIICTDGGAFQMLVNSHHYFPDLYVAAAACIKSGINQFLDDYQKGVYGALANKYITEADLDSVLRGVFRVMIKLGQLDPDEMVPYKKIGVKDTIDPWLTDAHKQLALDATLKSIVLLKNDKNTLPLQIGKLKTIAVIGTLADTVIMDWYSGNPPYFVSPLQGILNFTQGKVNVVFAPDNRYNKAVELAKTADVVIVLAGNNPTGNAGWAQCPNPSDGKEAVDRKSLDLEEEALIQKIYKCNPNVILVLQSSFPYTINWSQANLPAILHITHSSQETGTALAKVLFGAYNPAGRLVQTWPTDMAHLPPMMDYDITKGRTYGYFKHKPLYPFGYGLSYTQFLYSDMQINKQNFSATDTISVSFQLKNSGEMNGDEVVQLYVTFPDSKVIRPKLKLCAFNRVYVESGNIRQVILKIPVMDLAYFNEEQDRFTVEPGKIAFKIGGSSDTFQLSGNFSISK